MRALAIALFIVGTGLFPAHAQTGPAPDGDPVVVAEQIILKRFGPGICPFVTGATKLDDGSINALCQNGERFRVFTYMLRPIAMRCSVAEATGVEGC
jgi:hypothetical protein